MKKHQVCLGGAGEARSLDPQSSFHQPTTPGTTVFRAYRVELDPTKKQVATFLRYAGTARFIWNWALAQRIETYKNTKKSPTYFDQTKAAVCLKKNGFPWLAEISSAVVERSLKNLDLAFKAFFRRVKAGEKPGFPKFHSRNRGVGGFTLRKSISVKPNAIKLPCIGWVRLKEKGYIPTRNIKIKTATVTEHAGRWFVSVACEREIVVPINTGQPIGVDLGINHLAVTSDGQVFEAPRPLKKLLKKLKHLSRQHSRKQKGGQNRKKAARRLAKVHYRIACVRANTLHEITTALAKNHSLVAVEDLNVRGMMKNHNLAQAISDVGFAEFRRQLEYKCGWYGSRLVVVGRFFPSSKTCSGCGYVKEKLALSERVFQCEHCSLEIDRDLNAARNILVAGMLPETLNACGVGSRKSPTKKQERLRTSNAAG